MMRRRIIIELEDTNITGALTTTYPLAICERNETGDVCCRISPRLNEGEGRRGFLLDAIYELLKGMHS